MDSIQPADTGLYKGQALITFTYDDGKRSAFDNALPLHTAFNTAAAFAIIAERTDPKFRARFMGGAEVAEAARLGVEICSHSYSHRPLTGLDDADLDSELAESKRVLSALTPGREIAVLCVPYSRTDARVLAAALRHYPLIRVHGRKFTPVFPAGNPLVNAFGLTHETRFGEVREIVDAAVAGRAWVTLMLHGVTEGPDKPQNRFDVTAALLKDILRHVEDQGKDRLLPVTLSDIRRIRARGPA